jgi:predicted nuclease of restriction endonuclease-like RecB superfamily
MRKDRKEALQKTAENLHLAISSIDDALWLPWEETEENKQMVRITALRDRLIDLKLELHAERKTIK